MPGVTFVPADDNTRVEVALQHLDETIVVTEKGYHTDEPGEIAELDKVPTLERKAGRTKSAARQEASAG